MRGAMKTKSVSAADLLVKMVEDITDEIEEAISSSPELLGNEYIAKVIWNCIEVRERMATL